MLDNHFVMTICAPRNSGKTYFVRTLLESKMLSGFDYRIVFSPSLDLNHDYDNVDVHRCSDVTTENIEQVFKDCVKAKKIANDEPKEYRAPKVLIILDDCIDSGVLSFRGVADKLAERGRHADLSVIICAQRISAVSRSIRLNSDYFVIFRPYSIQEFQQYVEQFISKNKRKAVTEQILDVFDEKYMFIIVDNTERSFKKRFKASSAHDFVQGHMFYLDN